MGRRVLNRGARRAVLRVEADDARRVRGGLFQRELAEGHDDEAVADFAQVRGRAVEPANAGAARGLDRVGLETVAVLEVGDEQFFMGQKARGVHEPAVERQAALVFGLGPGHARMVELGFQE